MKINISIFKNKFKKEGSNQPDYKASMHNGVEFTEVGGGWIKETKNKDKFISLAINLDDVLKITPKLTEEESKIIKEMKEKEIKAKAEITDNDFTAF